MAELGRTAASEFAELGEGGVDWAVQGDPRGSWDPERLLRLFSSLFAYALEHGAAGEPMAVRIDGQSSDAVTVEVVGGKTVPEADAASLFDPFAAGGEKRGGMRLGLYIVDQIARAHGGSATAAPSGGRTRFTVRLPRRAGAA